MNPSARRRAAALSLSIAALATACGARTPLDLGAAPANDGAPASGSGGAPASTSSVASGFGGGAGVGGAGGSEALCTAFALTGPPLPINGVEGFDELRPALIREGDGGQRAILVWTWDGFEVGEGGEFHVDKVGVTGFEAWSEWPADEIGYGWLVTMDGGDAIATAPGIGPTVAIAVSYDYEGFEPGVYVHTSVKPEKPGGFPAIPLEPVSGRPLCVAEGDTHLVGYELTITPSHRELRYARVPSGEVTPGVGCADAPMVADAIPMGPGHLLAYSSGRPFGTCLNDDGFPGPPLELQLAIAGEDGSPEHVVTLEGGAPMAWVELASRPKGAWLGMMRNDIYANPLFEFAALDESGNFQSSFSVDAYASPSPPAMTGFGELLATARLDALDPSAPSIVVELWDASGKRVAEHWLAPDLEAWAAPELTLLASPAADALLVAWSAVEMPTGVRRLRVARLGCVFGPPP